MYQFRAQKMTTKVKTMTILLYRIALFQKHRNWYFIQLGKKFAYKFYFRILNFLLLHLMFVNLYF